MQAKINGSEPFKCIKNTFAIAGTPNGYTLMYSVDKENWTAYPDAVPQNETLIVNGCTPYMWFKLDGNEGEVDAIF